MLLRLVLTRISYIFPISLVSKLVNGMSNNTRDMVTYLENVVISSSLVNELQTVCHLTFLNWRCDTIKRREVSRETTADNPFFWRVHSFGFGSKRVRPPSLRISIEKSTHYYAHVRVESLVGLAASVDPKPQRRVMAGDEDRLP